MENTVKLMIKENGLSKSEAVNIVNNLINKRINDLKCEYMRAWERDHSISSDDVNNKIATLRKEESRIINDITDNPIQNSNKEIKTSFSSDFATA